MSTKKEDQVKTDQAKAVEVEKVEAKVEQPKSEQPKRQKQVEVKMDDLVPCRNISNGTLHFKSTRTGATYLWQGFNDVDMVPVSELVNMKASAGRILTEPWLIVEDDDVVKYLGLDNVYERMIPPEEVNAFFRLSVDEMKQKLDRVPKGTKVLIAEKASTIVADKENCFLSGAQIFALEQALGIDLSFVK